MIYNGFWWSPERLALQEFVNYSQKKVSGEITLKLFKGNVIVVSRSSKNSLYDKNISTFEDDSGVFNQKDSEGFIKLNALRLKNKRSK